jgi:hypothetical protein
MTLTIKNLKENRNEIISIIKKKKYNDFCTIAQFMTEMINEINDSFNYDEEESVMYNIESVMDYIFTQKMSKGAQAKMRKDNNQNSLRNIMGRSAMRNEDAGKTWNPIDRCWE